MLQAKFYRAFKWPSSKSWLETFLLWLIFAAVALPVALHYHFVTSAIAFSSWLPMALTVFIVPSLVEECLWRVFLIPLPGAKHFWPVGMLALLGYVLSHPLGAWLFRPTARDIFYHPAFLLLTGLLGFLCLLMYARSKSIWPALIMHWLSVAVWLFFGGRTLLES